MKYWLPWLGLILGLGIWSIYFLVDNEALQLIASLTGSLIFTFCGLKPLVERAWGK